ncbi:MAG: apolipoprotein N-acyltransferase, partial [candidate division Zixibacteria bacterium]|nr:apolipoprotein N-acyltransferase [candidate division Zixibacteria bacterium]
MNHKKTLFYLLLSALFFSLSFPPFPSGFLAYFCLVFLFFALQGKRGKESFKLGYIWGLVTNSLLLYWITWATLPGILGAILALSFYTAFLFLFYSWVQKSLKEKAIFFMPFLWVMMEYGRSLLDIGFPWLNLAYTQTYYLPLIQYASFTGNYGVSFWVVWVNVLVYFGIKAFGYPKRFLGSLVLLFLLFSIPYLYGKKVLNQEKEDEKVNIAMIQGNIPQDVKWDYEKMDYNFQVFSDLTKKIDEKVDLILWPETAAPCYLRAEPKYFSMVRSLAESLNTPILLGTNDFIFMDKDRYLYFNSVFCFKPENQPGKYQENPVVYNKIHLVPFSEWVPYHGLLGWLYNIKFGLSDYTPGKDYVIFENPKGKFSALICFEAVFPDLVRKFVLKGADFLVNVTNDGWFGKTSGPFQHARINVYRAIENRISIARCANTGISMFVDPYGRIKSSTKIYVQDILKDEISKRKELTFYTRYGDYFARGVFS